MDIYDNISEVTLSRLPRLAARLITGFVFDNVDLHILWGFFCLLVCTVLSSPHFFLIFFFHDHPQPHQNFGFFCHIPVLGQSSE